MIRKLYEQLFKVKTKQEALYWKQRLSLVYAVVGWNVFGVTFYLLVKDKIPTDPTERREAYGKLSGTSPNMHVYQISGLSITKDFDAAKAKMAKMAQMETENRTEQNENATKTDGK